MNFDRVISRAGTGSEKWDGCRRDAGKAEVIPLWVADMDFPAPPELAKALAVRAAHPVYGYTHLSESFYETLKDWYHAQYRLDLNRDNFLSGPGTVASLGVAVRAFTSPGDGVLLLTPVYKPFYNMIRFNGRETAEAPLRLNEEGRYSFDDETLGRALAAAAGRGLKVPLALFCSPHNPGGTVWDEPELRTFLDFARRHEITVISDEIHGDFVYPPKNFVSMAALKDHADRAAVVSAANKSFNLGGLPGSHFVVQDKKIAGILKTGLRAFGYDVPNIFSMIAAETAYRRCGPWLEELRAYIHTNIDEAVLKLQEIPGIRAFKPEGTYLIWAGVSGLIEERRLRDDLELSSRLEQDGRVKLTPGSAFGAGGRGFVRINAACPRSQLMEGLRRFKSWAETGSGELE
jgi:cystathionine beta-lyase